MMLLVLALAMALPQTAMFASHVDGQRWESHVDSSAVEAAPRWLETEDHPPLSPRAALLAARPMLRHITSHADQWRIVRILLHQLRPEVWLYVVEFDAPLLSGTIGSRIGVPAQIVVLMDGSAVTPVLGSAR